MKKFILILLSAIVATSCGSAIDPKNVIDNTSLGMQKDTVLSIAKGEPWCIDYDYSKDWGNYEYYYYRNSEDFDETVKITFKNGKLDAIKSY
jgi:hypothetical protein